MNKHTPGPWKAHFEEAYFVTGPDLGRVAMMMNLKGAHGMGGRRSGHESAANARLIAAAPELLEALQELHTIVSRAIHDGDWIVDGACDPDACMMRAEDLIAKATGEQK